MKHLGGRQAFVQDALIIARLPRLGARQRGKCTLSEITRSTDFCEGYYSDKAECESEACIPPELIGSKRKGDEDQKNVEPRGQQDELCGIDPAGFAIGREYLGYFLDKRRLARVAIAVGK